MGEELAETCDCTLSSSFSSHCSISLVYVLTNLLSCLILNRFNPLSLSRKGTSDFVRKGKTCLDFSYFILYRALHLQTIAELLAQ